MASGQRSGRSLESLRAVYYGGVVISSLRLVVTLVVALALAGCAVNGATPSTEPEYSYDVRFSATFQPKRAYAEASIRVSQQAGELKSLDLAAPSARFSNFAGDGDVKVKAGRVLWRVPRAGGELRYRVVIDHRRGGAFDARLTSNYAIFRLDDLFPRANVRARAGASSNSTLAFAGPARWSFETRYGPGGEAVSVDNPERNFDRPTGWAIAGRLGIRRGIIGGYRVAVAAPVGDDFRRQDILAFLRWTLPSVTAVFPQFPERLLIVGAGGDFWRGGLSGPGSLYMHSDRPLISENSTSSLLHELVHVATSSPPAPGDDWILEGLAEYYGLELLQRSGGISNLRKMRSFSNLEKWADEDNGRLTDPSTGANTARAATMFLALATELTDAGSSFDRLVKQLFAHGPVDRNRLQAIAAKLLGHPSQVLTSAYRQFDTP